MRILVFLLVLALCAWAEEPKGLQFTIKPGSPESEASKPLPRPAVTPLSPQAIQALLKRMPPLKTEKPQKFAMREKSLPAPKTGKTIPQAFPPPQPAPRPEVAKGEPKVLRYSPEGDVPLAPHLSVTFDQPMVPVSGVQDVAAEKVPVQLTPQPPGKWRWVGTRTLLYEPEKRFPMATDYQVSAPGAKFSFRTPTVTFENAYPTSGPQPLQPVIFISFNQAIDREQVLPTLKLTTGDTNIPIRLASSDEVAKDETVSRLARQAQKERWIALVPTQALPAGSSFKMQIGPGTPSAEGPRRTEQPQSFGFSTYSALQLVDYSREPRPSQPWYLRFNNPLEQVDPKLVRVSPELPGMKVSVSGDHLMVRGRSAGRTTYTVTVPASLTDKFGQRLGKDTLVTINVTSADPAFTGPGQNFVVIDPNGPPQLTCSVINYPSLGVHLRQVGPEDWAAYKKYLQEHRRNLKDMKLPGREVWSGEVPTNAKPDQQTEVKIDLRPGLPKSTGQLFIEVEPLPQPKEEWRQQRYVGWVQATQLGLDAMSDGDEMLVWANRLTDGQAAEGVQVSQFPEGASNVTGPDGLTRIPLQRSVSLLVGRKGDDLVILPREFSYWSDAGWTPHTTSDALTWYVMDDRKMYRPGEKVQIKGWVRRELRRHRGDLQLADASKVHWTLHDSRGNELLKGDTAVGKLGGFNFSIDLPKTINLGHTRLQLQADASGVSGTTAQHTFQVQEFRRPEFEVSASASKGAVLVGETATVTVSASYYAGGGLPNADVSWSVSSSPTVYSPPNWPEFSFGGWTPWWEMRNWWSSDEDSRGTYQSQQTRTDGSGKSTLALEFHGVNPPRPSSVSAQATVQDVNRQAWSANANLLVHPARIYVGLKAARAFVEQGQPIKMSMIVADLDGKAVSGRSVQILAYRNDWDWVDGEVKVKRVDETRLNLTSAAQPVEFEVPTKEGGTYRIEALVMDSDNRRNQSDRTIWVAGGKQPPSRNVEHEAITLVPSQKEFSPGQTAEILVQTPFAPAEAVVSWRRHGLVQTQKMSLPSGSTTLKIPVEADFTPNLHVQVDAVGSSPRTDAEGRPVAAVPPRPAYATGSLNLSIPPKDRKLDVVVTPAQKALSPGQSTEVNLTLKDAAGKPVQGEVALMMVDESVLALTGYDPADPMSFFYRFREAGVTDAHLRQYVELALPEELAPPPPPAPEAAPMTTAAPMEQSLNRSAPRQKAAARRDKDDGLRGGADEESKKESPIKVRSDFNPLAHFSPAVQTDAEGRARVAVKLPDNLTRYRIMALAVAGEKQFGKGQSSLTARQPLMVRPSAPRFLNFGDRFELPVVLQNQTDRPMDVQVAARASNAKLLQQGYQLKVPANDRVEVRFPATTESAGTARFQFVGVGAPTGVRPAVGGEADAAEVALPVWTPATTEAFATYGVLDEGAIAQAVQAPANVFPQFGGLQITTSSTALQELTDAYIYLQSYPYDCVEQIASRMISTAALKDVLAAFQAPGLPDPKSLKDQMARDVERLKGQQNYDGGWDFWRRGNPSRPYVTLHVAHTLVRCKNKGFAVDANMLRQALDYTRNIESHIPGDYPESVKRTLRAYALYVMRLSGEPNVAKAKALVNEVGVAKMPLESLGWLLPTLSKDPLAAEIRKHLNNQVSETAATAQFTTSYGDGDYLVLHSSRRDDAVLLEALIEDSPQNDVIPKLVRGLLDHRKRGRWENTQENCFVLLALDRYFQQYEKQAPNFVAQAWLGSSYISEQPFRGRSVDKNLVVVPMAQLQGREDLILQKSGTGRLYYRIGMDYAPTNLSLPPYEAGFAVQRKYEAVKDNRDVRRDGDGSWHIKAGSEVRVTVTMAAPSRRTHVALVDPLPAGLEAVNPVLAGSPRQPQPDHRRGRRWWSEWWFNHQNLRDERAEAFTELLWEGVYTYSYVARATTPGTFVVPPAKAEEMYHPETFGRSASDKVIVE